MSDLDFRAAERRWLQSRDPRDGAAVLLARVRRGELTDEAVHVAAAEPEDRREVLVGTVALCVLPWLHALLVVALVVGAGVLFLLGRRPGGNGDDD